MLTVYSMPPKKDAPVLYHMADHFKDVGKHVVPEYINQLKTLDRKLEKYVNNEWKKQYDTLFDLFKPFGVDKQGHLNVTKTADIEGVDEVTGKPLSEVYTEHVLYHLAKPGLEDMLGSDNMKKVEKQYQEMRKTGKAPEDTKLMEQVKQYITQAFGQIGEQQLDYEDLVKEYANHDLFSVLRDKEHPLHGVFLRQVASRHRPTQEHQAAERRLLRPESYSKLADAVDRLVQKEHPDLKVKRGIPAKSLLAEIKNLLNPNYRARPGKMYEQVKRQAA